MPDVSPPIRVDLGPKGLVVDREALAAALADVPLGVPVVALVHGFSFMPDLAGQCPHQHILALNPLGGDRRAISWPRHLGLDGRAGLALACGWPARGSVWQAHGRAAAAGRALAELARVIAEIAPGRRLDVVAHSLGARVALGALPYAEPGQFGRLILLAGAETRAEARAALDSPAGRAVQVMNVTTRENDLFDALFEWLVHFGSGTSVGQGLPDAPANWRDLWLDRAETLAALARMGHVIAPAQGRVSHWSPYLRPGVFSVYRALLSGDLSPDLLPKARPTRRWSRLFGLRPSVGRLAAR